MHECQDDLLLAYKLEMQKVERDYQEINMKINSDREITKTQQKIEGIRKELQWFKNEATRLYKKYEEQKTTLVKMKAALEVVEEDRDFYQQQLTKNRKINKNTAMQIKAFRKKYPQLHLMDLEREKNQGIFGENENEESLEHILKDQLDEPQKSRVLDEEMDENENNLENYDKVEFEKETPIKSQRLTKIKKENEGLKRKEKSFIDEINKLKKELDFVKKETREIRAQKAAENLEKTELKEFFLNCIEEVRRDIIRKKSAGIYITKRPVTEGNRMKRVTSVGTSIGFNKPQIQSPTSNKPFSLNDKKYFSRILSYEK